MGKHDPQRKAGWMRDPKAVSDHNQFPAVDQSDRWSERPTIKQERGDKHCAGAEQLGSKRTNLPEINLLVRFIPPRAHIDARNRSYRSIKMISSTRTNNIARLIITWTSLPVLARNLFEKARDRKVLKNVFTLSSRCVTFGRSRSGRCRTTADARHRVRME